MSNTQYAFLLRKNVPSRDSLQKTIQALNFDFELDPDFTPFTDEGFSPCTLNGDTDAGFEIYYEPGADIFEENNGLKAIAGDNDFCISLSWGGSMKDNACVMIISCALAKGCDAVISYEGDKPVSLEKIISETHEIINSLALDEVSQLDAQKALLEAKNSGTAESLILSKLDEIAGCSVTSISVEGLLGIHFSNGSYIMCKTFACQTIASKKIDVTRYSRIRAEQIEQMQSWPDEPTKEQKVSIDELESKLDAAGETDEKEAQLFLKEMEVWPEELVVEKIEWPRSNLMRILFCDLSHVYLELYALDSNVYTISFRTGLLEFEITRDACGIVE